MPSWIPRPDHVWSAVLGAGVLLVGALSIGPVLAPRPHAPAVTRVALPPPRPATAEPPVYASTGSITPLISGRVNVNMATQEQLEALPEVGPSLARAIIAGRPHRSLADLDRVKGVGVATLRVLTPLVSF